jgi:hypothetical protein
MYKLPRECLIKIYQYDSTYHDKFKKVLKEFIPKYYYCKHHCDPYYIDYNYSLCDGIHIFNWLENFKWRREVTIKNHVKHGKYKKYDENNLVAEYNFHKGKFHGIQKEIKNGILHLTEYEHNVVFRQEFYKDGKLLDPNMKWIYI